MHPVKQQPDALLWTLMLLFNVPTNRIPIKSKAISFLIYLRGCSEFSLTFDRPQSQHYLHQSQTHSLSKMETIYLLSHSNQLKQEIMWTIFYFHVCGWIRTENLNAILKRSNLQTLYNAITILIMNLCAHWIVSSLNLIWILVYLLALVFVHHWVSKIVSRIPNGIAFGRNTSYRIKRNSVEWNQVCLLLLEFGMQVFVVGLNSFWMQHYQRQTHL